MSKKPTGLDYSKWDKLSKELDSDDSDGDVGYMHAPQYHGGSGGESSDSEEPTTSQDKYVFTHSSFSLLLTLHSFKLFFYGDYEQYTSTPSYPPLSYRLTLTHVCFRLESISKMIHNQNMKMFEG